MDLPNEVWTKILHFCDIPSVLNLMRTCKRLLAVSNTEIVWLYQWQKLMVSYPQHIASCTKNNSRLMFGRDDETEHMHQILKDEHSDPLLQEYDNSAYKKMCMRFTKIFGLDPSQDYVCCKCSSVLCNTYCMENSDELIIFDFGSKTTWFKYESENTGQLSMHPTVAPIAGVASADLVAKIEDPMLTDACPVCTKIIKKRQTGILASNGGSKDKRKFSSAFTKLSLRGLHCFESSQLDTDETEYTAVLPPAEGSSETVNAHSVGPEDCEINIHSATKVESLLFLMTHMLKRSAFLPGKNIPFVICEPLHISESMKWEVVRYVFEELKVPGVCFLSKPIAISLYIGLDTCLVVDSGANNTIVTPVVNQQSMTEQWKPVGGRTISAHLKQCIRMKHSDVEVDDGSLDASQVKRECWLAYNPDTESKRNIPNRSIIVKVQRVSEVDQRLVSDGEHCQIPLSHELYLAVENMYIYLQLATMIQQAVSDFEPHVQTKLLSNIVLSGGNCRLNGLANRLTRDLQEVLPQHSHCIRVCDPRLMTGRTDVVVGASYIKRLDSVNWITRQDYVCYGEDIMHEISC